MNEDYFTGFEKSYVFFDDENDMMISFGENGLAEISINDDFYGGKWRFSKAKQLVEIFVPDLDFKVIYKMKIMKEDKEKDESFLMAKFVIKYNSPEKEDKKGSTTFVKSINDLKPSNGESSTSKIEKIITLSVFILLFLIILFISSFIPVISEAGIVYSSAIILTIQILLINKIKTIVSNQVAKYEESIKKMFYS